MMHASHMSGKTQFIQPSWQGPKLHSVCRLWGMLREVMSRCHPARMLFMPFYVTLDGGCKPARAIFLHVFMAACPGAMIPKDSEMDGPLAREERAHIPSRQSGWGCALFRFFSVCWLWDLCAHPRSSGLKVVEPQYGTSPQPRILFGEWSLQFSYLRTRNKSSCLWGINRRRVLLSCDWFRHQHLEGTHEKQASDHPAHSR